MKFSKHTPVASASDNGQWLTPRHVAEEIKNHVFDVAQQGERVAETVSEEVPRQVKHVTRAARQQGRALSRRSVEQARKHPLFTAAAIALVSGVIGYVAQQQRKKHNM